MKKYKIVIVEDDPMARKLLELSLSQQYEIVASIDNADLIDIYCINNTIDLVIMDVRTAEHANGLEAASRIKKTHPNIKVLIVTSMPEFSYINTAKQIGVEGFCYKDMKFDPLNVIEAIMKGEYVFPEQTPVIKLGNINSNELSQRELEVLKELTTGATNQMIADKLCITLRTVKAHITHLQEKTGYTNRTELAIRARESGITIGD